MLCSDQKYSLKDIQYHKMDRLKGNMVFLKLHLKSFKYVQEKLDILRKFLLLDLNFTFLPICFKKILNMKGLLFCNPAVLYLKFQIHQKS